eukprot:Opistho-2@36414
MPNTVNTKGRGHAQDVESDAIVLTQLDYDRLKEHARIKTRQEELNEMSQERLAKISKLEDARDRKVRMQGLDNSRVKNQKLNEIEQEAVEKSNYLRQRAQILIDEEEDEIKHMNELLLNAKCMAIRDVQIHEKQLIRRELVDEDRRLDTLMETERIRAIEDFEARERAVREERERAAQQIKRQIEDREQQRLIEAELRDQETRAILEEMDRRREEDLLRLQQRKEEQRKFLEDVALSNEEALRHKKELAIREKEYEQKLAEYAKEKEQREHAYQLEVARNKAEREKERERIYRLQQESSNEEEAREALRAKRVLESVEREWRRKERDEAEKQRNNMDRLVEARAQQVHEKKHYLALQAYRDRADFERVIEVQKALELAEKEKVKEEELRRIKVAEEVRGQIRGKETQRQTERKDFFAEGRQQDKDAQESWTRSSVASWRSCAKLAFPRSIATMLKGGQSHRRTFSPFTPTLA